MEAAAAFWSLGISLLLGLLVGMQRERVEPRLAGIRTFALITLLGTVCGLAAHEFGGWIVGAGLIGVAAAMVVGNLYSLKQNYSEPGITTEVAVLVMFAVGAYLAVGPLEVGAAAGAAVAILLHAKKVLHGIVAKLGDRDVRAIMQFALITCIILPVVPNEKYGPLNVLNPHEVWLMVVLVVGISLGGYVAYRFLGGRAGAVLAGVLGGLVSSTATTVSGSRRAAGRPAAQCASALVIVTASAVVYVRILAEIGAVSRGFFPAAAGPIGVMLGTAVIAAAAVWWRMKDGDEPMAEQENPAELKAALYFGGMYAAVVLAVEWAGRSLGAGGVYAVAAVSGLTDMDAITLSSARMAGAGTLEAGTAWRSIVLAVLSNLVFKTVLVAWIGGRGLSRWVVPVFLAQALAGAAVLAFWPS